MINRISKNRQIIFLVFIFFSLIANFLTGQDKKVLDSLTREYNNNSDEKRKIIALFRIGLYYIRSKPDTSFFIAQKVIERSEKIKFEGGEADGCILLGSAHHYKANNTKAIEYYQKAYEKYKKIDNQKGMGDVYNNLAGVYESEGNLVKSLEYYKKSLFIDEGLKNIVGISTSYNNIGIVYMKMKDFEKSLEYHQKSLKIRQELKDEVKISISLINIANVLIRKDDYDKALEYLHKALAIQEAMNDKKSIAVSVNNIGRCLMFKKEDSKAIPYLERSYKIFEELGFKRQSVIVLNNISKILLNQKEYDKSIEYASKMLTEAEKIKALQEYRDASVLLYENYKGKKDYVKALEYHELYKNTNDSIFNTENSKRIANIEARFEIGKKAKEIDILNKNQVILQKENELKRIEIERQKNAKLALEKQAEADRFLALAQEEKNKHKQDSLLNLAQKKQLEADKFKAKELQLSAENKAKQAELMKEKETKKFQECFLYLVTFALLLVSTLAYVIYGSHQKEKKSKQLIALQKEEIQVQAENLQELNQVKDKLFAIISHDLRSPLAQLQGVLSLVEMDLVTEQEFKKIIPEIQKNVKFTSELTSNLLTWSNSQLEGINYNPQLFDIFEIAENKINLFEKTSFQKGIKILNLIPTDTNVFADKNMIDLVIRNFVANAVKFCKENDTITILCKEEDDTFLRIEVQDTGVGIAPENISKLFGNTNFTTRGTSNEKGTGLGLMLCKDFVTRNGGKIGVESEQGKGSSFYFTIPKKEYILS